MKKVHLLFMAVLMVFVVVLSGCGSKEEPKSSAAAGASSKSPASQSAAPDKPDATKKKYDLKMATTANAQSTWYQGAEQFANEVSKNTAGRIKISIFPGEQLSGGDSKKAVEMLAKGEIDVSYHSNIMYANVNEKLGVTSAPFLFKDFAAVDKALAGKGGEALNKIIRDLGIEPLGFGQNGFRQLTNNVRPVHSPADVKGIKIRTPGIAMYDDLWKQLGATPTKLPASEIFPSLQKGTVDAQENAVDVVFSFKLQEVQKHLTMFNYSYDPVILGINKKLFDSMDPGDQDIIRKAAANANQYQIKVARDKEKQQLAELKEKGMDIYDPTEQELEAFKKAVEPVYAKYEAIWGKELLDSFR